MRFTKTEFSDLLVMEPLVFKDERGEFMETFSEKQFSQHVPGISFVQDNQSVSKKMVFRGFHFQKPPFAQAKLVRVPKGRVMDYVIDLRSQSETFNKLFQIELSEENQKMLFVPAGFAHGFQSLEDDTIFQYKCSQFYEPSSEGGILFSSVPDLTLDTKSLIVNAKDSKLSDLSTFITPF